MNDDSIDILLDDLEDVVEIVARPPALRANALPTTAELPELNVTRARTRPLSEAELKVRALKLAEEKRVALNSLKLVRNCKGR